MTALTGPRRATAKRLSGPYSRQVAAGVRIFQGSIVALTAAGYATPGAVSATLKDPGIAKATVDNIAGAAGAQRVDIEKGTFPFANSAAGDLITIADIGNDCFIVDDQTVARTNGGATRSKAGIVADVDAAGVWVRFV